MVDAHQSPRIAILGGRTSWHARQLSVSFQRRGISLQFADPTRLLSTLGEHGRVRSAGVDLSALDLLLVRDLPGGSLEQVIFRMDALHQLENSGVRVVNSPFAIEKMVDKYYTISLLADAGLPVPESRICENLQDARRAFRDLGRDVVLKPLFGSRGLGMVRLNDDDSAYRAFNALQLGGYVYYLQRFIQHNNRDIRVMVVGKECPAAMERVGQIWKTNIAFGASPVPVELPIDVQQLSLDAATCLGAEYCGVDVLRTPSGELFLLEVNSIPAWRGLQQVTNTSIAEIIAAHCLRILGI